MHLETIRDFEWYNEPEFRFDSGAMLIKANPETEFWQDARRAVCKDNGHFFFIRHSGDVTLTVQWKAEKEQDCSAQYGLMGRIDALNWFKVSLVRQPDRGHSLALSVTNLGHSDLTLLPLPRNMEIINLRLEILNGDFCLSYATDDGDFFRVRMFQMLVKYEQLKMGAYICNPGKAPFSAKLLDINFY